MKTKRQREFNTEMKKMKKMTPEQQRQLDQVKMNINQQGEVMMTIKQQRELDQAIINVINEDSTYLPTLEEAEIFRNYVLEYIDIWGIDDFQEDVIPQLYNLFFIDIAREVLNDYKGDIK